MAEQYKKQRVSFSTGKQSSYIARAKKILSISDKNMAVLLKISQRTLSDWKREKYHISLTAVEILADKAKLEIPKDIKILPPFWSAEKAAKLGAQATIKKYGAICTDPEKRKTGWYRWWQTEGRFIKKSINQPMDVRLPRKSEKLAEFVGIVMGDGGITDYQVIITLNKRDDADYAVFVADLMKSLFQVEPSRNFRQSVVNVCVSRKKLVDYCQKIGLKKGNKIKQAFDIPDWIKINNKFMRACLRGLFDTDGSVFLHKYKANSKYYTYTKIAFTSCSKPLLTSYFQFLQKEDIKVRYSRGKDVRIDGQEAVRKFIRIIGSHNPKHIVKFENFTALNKR